MKKIILLALPLIFAGCASTSQQPLAVAKADSQQEVAKAEAKKEKLKCVDSRATGSQMKKKRCWDKKEYEQFKEQSKESLRRAIEQGGTRKPIN